GWLLQEARTLTGRGTRTRRLRVRGLSRPAATGTRITRIAPGGLDLLLDSHAAGTGARSGDRHEEGAEEAWHTSRHELVVLTDRDVAEEVLRGRRPLGLLPSDAQSIEFPEVRSDQRCDGGDQRLRRRSTGPGPLRDLLDAHATRAASQVETHEDAVLVCVAGVGTDDVFAIPADEPELAARDLEAAGILSAGVERIDGHDRRLL